MKKITKNIFLSLALLACGVTPLATSLSFGVNRDIVANTNESQIADSDDVLEDNPISDDDTGNSGESEPITYTYKSYYDYFIDHMDCTGVYDTEDNLTDVTISVEKKAEILSYDFTGSGTASDPYQVNTTNGFWYMHKFVTNLNYKYIEINSNITLNDEKFDKNGNPGGGDGVVYMWRPRSAGEIKILDGKGYKVVGLYINQPTTEMRGLFSGGNIDYVKNFNMRETYINAKKWAYSLVSNINTLENCSFSGTIRASADYALGACNVVSIIKNCKNYTNIYSEASRCAGFANYAKEIYDSENYGNVVAGSYSGGFVGFSQNLNIVENCTNYGNVHISKSFCAGGIIGQITSGAEKLYSSFKNVKNYGEISSTGNAAIGGIAGYVGANALFFNCTNFGSVVFAGYSAVGNVVGEIATISNDETSTDIYIKDCLIESMTGSVPCVIGAVRYDGTRKLNIYIENVKININNKDVRHVFLKFGNSLNVSLYVKNCQIDVNEDLSGKDLNLINDYDYNVAKNISISNIYIKDNVGNVTLAQSSKFDYNSVLISYNNGKGVYYGTNFRDFYLSWKYGTIGLKPIDGIGSAQGSITTAWLEENGWIKKSL